MFIGMEYDFVLIVYGNMKRMRFFIIIKFFVWWKFKENFLWYFVSEVVVKIRWNLGGFFFVSLDVDIFCGRIWVYDMEWVCVELFYVKCRFREMDEMIFLN